MRRRKEKVSITRYKKKGEKLKKSLSLSLFFKASFLASNLSIGMYKGEMRGEVHRSCKCKGMREGELSYTGRERGVCVSRRIAVKHFRASGRKREGKRRGRMRR